MDWHDFALGIQFTIWLALGHLSRARVCAGAPLALAASPRPQLRQRAMLALPTQRYQHLEVRHGLQRSRSHAGGAGAGSCRQQRG